MHTLYQEYASFSTKFDFLSTKNKYYQINFSHRSKNNLYKALQILLKNLPKNCPWQGYASFRYRLLTSTR